MLFGRTPVLPTPDQALQGRSEPAFTVPARHTVLGTPLLGSALLAQVPHAQVTGRCGCGCATVELDVDRAAAAPAPPHVNPAVDAGYTGPHSVGVMVCTEDGYLSLLEIYSVGDEPVSTWPDPRLIER